MQRITVKEEVESVTEKYDDVETDGDEVVLSVSPPDDFREQGLFWVGLGGTAQPDGRWIQIAHVLVEDRNLDFIRTVSLLAQLSAGV